MAHFANLHIFDIVDIFFSVSIYRNFLIPQQPSGLQLQIDVLTIIMTEISNVIVPPIYSTRTLLIDILFQ